MKILGIVMFTFGVIGIFFGCQAPEVKPGSKPNELILIEDKLALKYLVDEFSVLADRKDVAAQMDLFTDDAIVQSYRDGKLSSTLNGKDEIEKAFENFLSSFETVYHINGQQQVNINGDSATGISYCLVVLIRILDGQLTKTTYGVSYNDVYVRQNGKWLIANRKSHFNWEDIDQR